jgi:hypothetical protein
MVTLGLISKLNILGGTQKFPELLKNLFKLFIQN